MSARVLCLDSNGNTAYSDFARRLTFQTWCKNLLKYAWRFLKSWKTKQRISQLLSVLTRPFTVIVCNTNTWLKYDWRICLGAQWGPSSALGLHLFTELQRDSQLRRMTSTSNIGLCMQLPVNLMNQMSRFSVQWTKCLCFLLLQRRSKTMRHDVSKKRII